MPELDRDGVAVHYDTWGAATDRLPLLLSHGYSASSGMWAPNRQALSARRQVITWDLRGHGASQSPTDPTAYAADQAVADMAAILDAAQVDRAAVGGLSLGGYLSLLFHLAHPERVAALLLVDTGPGFRNDEARQRWNDRAEAYAVGFDTRGLGALAASPEVLVGPHDPRGLAAAARGTLVQHDAAVMDSLGSIARAHPGRGGRRRPALPGRRRRHGGQDRRSPQGGARPRRPRRQPGSARGLRHRRGRVPGRPRPDPDHLGRDGSLRRWWSPPRWWSGPRWWAWWC